MVVNDLGATPDGGGADREPAQLVVDEIIAMGGQAVANTDNVADFAGGQAVVECALDTFGSLDVVVNNAGVLRDQMLVNMSIEDWDAVVAVHLRGHFCVTRHAAAYWRKQSKAGEKVKASLIHTSSVSGLFTSPGQANYSTVKAGIAAFSMVCAAELQRYGVRSNAIAPAARTRLTENVPVVGDLVKAPGDGGFDWYCPANVSPMVAYLATAECPFTGETFFVGGDNVTRFTPFGVAETLSSDGRRWTVSDLAAKASELSPEHPRDEAAQRARLRPQPTAAVHG